METPKGTIWIDDDQYKEILEYSQQGGRTVHEIIVEALNEWIDSGPMKAHESQGQ
jgi:hypothetical protein